MIERTNERTNIWLILSPFKARSRGFKARPAPEEGTRPVREDDGDPEEAVQEVHGGAHLQQVQGNQPSYS